VRETEILVEQQPPQGVFVCDHAGVVINKFSLNRTAGVQGVGDVARDGAHAVHTAGRDCLTCQNLAVTVLHMIVTVLHMAVTVLHTAR